MARPTNTAERRAQIVEALRQVMAAEGYERASVGRIARAAGLTPGLVHYHFPSKQAILLELVEGLTAAARRRIEDRLAAAGASPRERVRAFLDGLLALGDGAAPEATTCWALIGAEAIRQPEVRALRETWLAAARAALEDLLRAACRAEGRSTRELAAAAAGLLAAVEGYYAIAAAQPSIVPRGSAARIARRMANGLIDAQPLRGRGTA